MKTWFRSHRVRRKRSEPLLSPIQMNDPEEALNGLPPRQFPLVATSSDSPARNTAPKASSRISIERYLQAPLEDEPASVPAISAALQRQFSTKSARGRAQSRAGKSRESSFEAHSEGTWTAKAPASSGTSYSVASKIHRPHHQRSTSHPEVPVLTRLATIDSFPSIADSPERPTTSGTVDIKSTWAGYTGNLMHGLDCDVEADYRARAEEEIARIQEKAIRLEEQIQRYKIQRRDSESPAQLLSRVSDEMAFAQMEAQPKLAWILGGDVVDARRIQRPQSSGSGLASAIDIPDRPGSSGTLGKTYQSRVPRRSKSSGALDEGPRLAAIGRRAHAVVERRPSKRPKFYCTFCLKRFHSRLEWMRHEQIIHMPEELWVCCPRTEGIPDHCPFCTKADPSTSHLAGHNYFFCQEKSISERTFNRQDYFLQHISREHKVSPGQKPLRLTELLEAWRHPLPLTRGHQALHCGFCGLTFPSYGQRTEHVGKHFMEGLDMMSWWNERINHDIPHPKPSEAMHRNAKLSHQCSYCERVYENLAVAHKLHSVCTMWSCSFLPGMQYTVYPAGTRDDLKAVCCYCNDTLVRGAGKVKGEVLKEHINQHNFRKCNQRLYFSGQRFRQHLQDSHKTKFDGTLHAGWPLLLKSCKKTKPAVFEPVDASMPVRRAFTDPGTTGAKPPSSKPEPHVPKMNFMDLSETPQRSTAPTRKLQRKASVQTMPDKSTKQVRESPHFFTRAATLELPLGKMASPSPRLNGLLSPRLHHTQHRPGFPLNSLPVDAVDGSPPVFYRRRLDASTRNRLYVRDTDDGQLSKNGQKLFRRVEGSLFGGLVLHSSLLGAVPSRMTNSVDVYSLH